MFSFFSPPFFPPLSLFFPFLPKPRAVFAILIWSLQFGHSTFFFFLPCASFRPRVMPGFFFPYSSVGFEVSFAPFNGEA